VSAVDVTTAPPPPPATEAEPARPSAPLVAPTTTAIAWQELHAIQRRQDEIWGQRVRSEALPAVGVAVGLPAFGTMLPFGSMLVARARDGYDGAEAAEHDRRVGAALIACGLVGLAAFIAGSVALARIHKERMRRETETKSLSDRRTLLESLLEAEWRAKRGQSAP
jgi:hypothetical protein